MISGESGVTNSSRSTNGWMTFDGEGSWCDLKRQVRSSSQWRAGRAHWHGSLHSGAIKGCSFDNILPAARSDLNWLSYYEAGSFLARASLLHY